MTATAAAWWIAAGAASSAAAQLAPHRAFYELQLAGAAQTLVAAQGAFAVEWRAECTGMASQQRLWFVGRTEDGAAFDYDVRFTTWESRDHRTLRFSMRSFQAGELVEEFRGQARLPADGGPGRATYTVPPDVEVALPPDTVFPTGHVERLIELAAAGETFASMALFDGAGVDDDALALVTAVIGAARPATAGSAADRAWPMSLAYHPLAEGDLAPPMFELSFELSAHGVMRDVLLDYGAFALQADLSEFERLSPPACE